MEPARPVEGVRPEAREALNPAGKPSDSGLVDAIAAMRGRLIGLATRLLWNRDDAEEIVQEAAALAVARNRERAGRVDGPWLVRTVVNLCRNLKRRRRPESISPWIETIAKESKRDPVELREELERTRAALDKLPDQQRVALVLRTMEQMAYAEIAEIMSVTEQAVRTHVHLARRKMVDMLREKAGD
jgi:RNA polymerase sigma-70 factor (ECF subfamily)